METKYEEIYKKIWELSPVHKDPIAYEELNSLTQKLIQIYDQQGRLNADPFDPTRERKLSEPSAAIHSVLTGSTCLVTGGLGCVGSTLVNTLIKYNVNKVVIL